MWAAEAAAASFVGRCRSHVQDVSVTVEVAAAQQMLHRGVLHVVHSKPAHTPQTWQVAVGCACMPPQGANCSMSGCLRVVCCELVHGAHALLARACLLGLLCMQPVGVALSCASRVRRYFGSPVRAVWPQQAKHDAVAEAPVLECCSRQSALPRKAEPLQQPAAALVKGVHERLYPRCVGRCVPCVRQERRYRRGPDAGAPERPSQPVRVDAGVRERQQQAQEAATHTCTCHDARDACSAARTRNPAPQ